MQYWRRINTENNSKTSLKMGVRKMREGENYASKYRNCESFMPSTKYHILLPPSMDNKIGTLTLKVGNARSVWRHLHIVLPSITHGCN
jgi:hypothetical protein